MSSQEEKEIILHHNDNYHIKVKIKNDYEFTIKAVQEALYYSDKEMENLIINFLDDDNYENMLDEDNIEDAFQAKEWVTSKKDSPEPNPAPVDNKEIEKLKAENSQLKAQIRNSNAIQESIKKCNDKYKLQLEQLKNKFIEELKQRETLNQKNIEQITKNLTECAQGMIKSKVEDYNNKIKNDLNTKIEESKVNLNKGISEINNVLKTINENKEGIKKQIEESNNNFSRIIEISQVNINGNK